MGRAVKLFLVLALIVSLGGFTMSIVSAQQAGLSVPQLAEIIENNMRKLNMGMVMSEYNDVREVFSVEPEGEIRRVVIQTSFPDVIIRQGGSEFAVYLEGDVSAELDDLMTEKQANGTAYIDIAAVFNENPSATGLNATVVVPRGLAEIAVLSVSGGILVDGIDTPKIDLESKSGSIEVQGIQIAELRIRTASGDIAIFGEDDLEVDAESASGNLLLTCDAVSGTISTASGSMDLDFHDLNEDLSLTSDSGLISIFFQGDDLNYDFTDSAGWINNSNVDTTLRRGRIGAGSYELNAASESNGIVFTYTEEDRHE